MVFSISQLSHLTLWAQQQAGFSQLGVSARDLYHFDRAVDRQQLGPSTLRVYRQLQSLLQGGEAPDSFSLSMLRVDSYLNDGVRILSQSAQQLDQRPLNSTNDSQLIPMPLVNDPRVIELPKQSSEKRGEAWFVHGVDAKKQTVTAFTPRRNIEGELILVARTQKITGEVTKLRQWGHLVFTEGETQYYSLSPYEESPIFALHYDADDPQKSRIVRYPDFQSAGLQPPLKHSRLNGSLGTGSEYEHYHLTMPFAEQSFELTIIEDDQKGIQKLADFRLGQEFLREEQDFQGHPLFRINDELVLLLKRKESREGVYYQGEFWHEIDENWQAKRIDPGLEAVVLDSQNVSWVEAVTFHSQRLKFKILNFYHQEALLKELYDLKKQGVGFVHEVIQTLYHDSETQMYMIQALQAAKGLPLPADTRIVPTSTQVLTGLVELFTHHNPEGVLSKALIIQAKTQFQIPERFIEGLWLGLQRETLARLIAKERGASTPDFVYHAPPINETFGLIDETHNPFWASSEDRSRQRESIVDVLNYDHLASGFRTYLGEQLRLAREFDLLILESGALFHQGQRVYPTWNKNQERIILDAKGQIFSLGTSIDDSAIPLQLSEESLNTKLALFDYQEEDPFRFFWLSASAGGHGASFAETGMLIRGAETHLYRKPRPSEVADSLRGLLKLPENYLERLDFQLDPSFFETSSQNIEIVSREPEQVDLSEQGYHFAGVPYHKVTMVPYLVQIEDLSFEVYLPAQNSHTSQVLGKDGFYIPKPEDLPQIARYYYAITRQGYYTDYPRIILLPGKVSEGTEGYYMFDSENIYVSSQKADHFDQWAGKVFFDVIRHELAHAFHRINPWISSMALRTLALDGMTMQYGDTNVDEYWAVLVQNFFDHPQNRYRFPNGYRLIYTLLKLKEMGLSWDGPHHLDAFGDFIDEEDLRIDGLDGVLKTLATGGDPWQGFLERRAA